MASERRHYPRVHKPEHRKGSNKATYPDGLSLYRSISRQLYGDPSKYGDVLKAVLDHFLRIWIQPDHEHHGIYCHYVSIWPRRDLVRAFFGALSCPDLVYPDQGMENVLTVITNALNIRLIVWPRIPENSDTETLHDLGPVAVPECHLLQSKIGPQRGWHYDTLLEDESGQALITYMHNLKERGELDVKEICWYDFGPGFERSEPKCYNEYRPLDQQLRPGLRGSLDFLWVYTVSISDDTQIEAAINAIEQALQRAPAQEGQAPRRIGGYYRPLRRYLGVDAEFKWVHINEDDLQSELQKTDDKQQKKEILKGRQEQLCSVLTIAIDRHVVFSFYMLHMLENAQMGTVKNLESLFRGIIFNQQILKIWFNYQQDIPVLQATIAHMYQKTPRNRHFLEKTINGTRHYRWEYPTFKFRSPYLNGVRPPGITFINHSTPCFMHEQPEIDPAKESNENLRSCPCYTGNVDITALLDYILRQLRWRTDGGNQPLKEVWSEKHLIALRPWTESRQHCSYGDFLHWTAGTDRLYPYFQYFKNYPTSKFSSFKNGEEGKEKVTAWYNSLGPDMVTDDNKMGYNIGDVVGIALFMRFLTTTDDRMLLVGRHANYAVGQSNQFYCNVGPSQSPKAITQNLVGLPLVVDNPRLWARSIIGYRALPQASKSDKYGTEVSKDFYRPDSVDTLSMSYPEHEECVSASRRAYKKHYPKYISSDFNDLAAYTSLAPITREQHRQDALQSAHCDLFDPTRFELPEGLTVDPSRQSIGSSGLPPGQQVIIRAGTTHTEDLLYSIYEQNRIRGRSRYGPSGFTRYELPDWINRSPGRILGNDVDQAFDSTSYGTKPDGSLDTPPDPIPLPPPPRGSQLPGSDRHDYDIYDPDGLEYRRLKSTYRGGRGGGRGGGGGGRGEEGEEGEGGDGPRGTSSYSIVDPQVQGATHQSRSDLNDSSRQSSISHFPTRDRPIFLGSRPGELSSAANSSSQGKRKGFSQTTSQLTPSDGLDDSLRRATLGQQPTATQPSSLHSRRSSYQTYNTTQQQRQYGSDSLHLPQNPLGPSNLRSPYGQTPRYYSQPGSQPQSRPPPHPENPSYQNYQQPDQDIRSQSGFQPYSAHAPYNQGPQSQQEFSSPLTYQQPFRGVQSAAGYPSYQPYQPENQAFQQQPSYLSNPVYQPQDTRFTQPRDARIPQSQWHHHPSDQGHFPPAHQSYAQQAPPPTPPTPHQAFPSSPYGPNRDPNPYLRPFYPQRPQTAQDTSQRFDPRTPQTARTPQTPRPSQPPPSAPSALRTRRQSSSRSHTTSITAPQTQHLPQLREGDEEKEEDQGNTSVPKKKMNKVVEINKYNLRKRKRVRDNQERIDAVLERAQKMARLKQVELKG